MTSQWEGVAEIPTDVEGVTHQGFRFRVSVVVEKLMIWLEDRKTKRQWRTKALRVADFVTHNSAIPQATACDYAKRFVECLQADVAHSDAVYGRMINGADKDGSCVLRLWIKLAFSTFHVQLDYMFILLPVALETVDLLTAQVRDLQDQLMEMKQQTCSSGRAHATFELKEETSTNRLLQWKAKPDMNPAWFAVDDNVIVIRKSGTYHGIVSVLHTNVRLPIANTSVLNIIFNGATVKSATDMCGQGTCQLVTTFFLEVEDQGKVVVSYCNGETVHVGNSFLDLVEV